MLKVNAHVVHGLPNELSWNIRQDVSHKKYGKYSLATIFKFQNSSKMYLSSKTTAAQKSRVKLRSHIYKNNI